MLVGRIALITGANSGIGYETALALAKNGCRVYLACRAHVPEERDPRETIEAMRRYSGNDEVFFIEADVSSMGSVRRTAKEFASREEKLDILINNAGACEPLRSLLH